MDLHMQRWGELGAPALLVHGSVTNGELAWELQRPLSKRWSLLVLDRRGYHPNPPIEREDFEVDAGDVAELLAEHGPVHLVGHSYGGVIALLAAAREPDFVRSLVLVEPVAFGVLENDPEVRGMSAALREYWKRGPQDPEAFLRGFREMTGAQTPLPSPLSPSLLQSARLLRAERFPGEAVIPFIALRRGRYPKLVISGGHNRALEKLSDAVAAGIGGRRVVIEGAAHSVQRTGQRFNDEVERLWRSAEALAA